MLSYLNPLYKQFNKRLVQFQEMFLRNERVIGSPFALVLESGNICNLKCPLCPTPVREKRIPKGMLTLENAKKIIDGMPALVDLNMSLWGEPFLNKEIFEIVSYAQKKGIKVLIQSNLNKFDKHMAQKMIDSELDHLMISLDGASQETYEKYRVGGDFKEVLKNIQMITDMQKVQNNHKTMITWKIVVHKFNEHEVEKAKQWSKDLGIHFRTVEIYTPPGLENDWKPKTDLSVSENVYTDRVELCYSLWQAMIINFNGDVFPCCSEWSREDAIGNVFTEPVKKIWNNKKYRVLRKLNKKTLNCQVCHRDKKTNWYEVWGS